MQIKTRMLFFLSLVIAACQPKEDQQEEKPNQECVEPTPENPLPTDYCVQYPIPFLIDDKAIMRSAMTLDSNDKIHIVYSVRIKPDTEEYYLFYASNVFGKWQITAFDLPVNNFNDLNIVVDLAGYVHIVFSNCSLTNDFFPCSLKYLTSSSGIWTIETIKEEGNLSLLEIHSFGNLSVVVDAEFVIHLSYISTRYNGSDLFMADFLQHTKKHITDKKWQSKVIMEFWSENHTSDDITLSTSPLVLDSQGNLHIVSCYNKDLEYFKNLADSGYWKGEKIALDVCEGIGDLAADKYDNLYLLYSGENVEGKSTLYLGLKKEGVWQFNDVYHNIPKEFDWGPTALKIIGDKFYIFRGGIIGFEEKKCLPPEILAPDDGYGYVVLLVSNSDGWQKYYLPDVGTGHSFYYISQFNVGKDSRIYLVFGGSGPVSYFGYETIDLPKGLFYYTWSEDDPKNLCANIENSETCCGCTDFSQKCVLDYQQWECPAGCFERYTWVSSWQWPEQKFIEEKAQYIEIKPETIL